MTDSEKQTIIDAVLSAIRTNSRTINQLTPVTSLNDTDFFEVSGGRRISFPTLITLISEILMGDRLEPLQVLIEKCSNDIRVYKNSIGQANGIAPLDANTRLSYDHLPQSAIDSITMLGTINLADLDVPYNDSLAGRLIKVISDSSSKLPLGWLMFVNRGDHSTQQVFITSYPINENGTLILNGENNKIYIYRRNSINGSAGWNRWENIFGDNNTSIIIAESESDLDIKDENDYVLAQLADGHIKTKNFDSREAATMEDVTEAMPIATQESEDADVQIADESGNVVMEIADGHIRTKNFDSAAIDVEQDVAVVGTESDFEVADESGNVVMRVDGGHIKTRFFDSAEAATGASNRLRILCIGNSYTANSISYMPYILQEVMPSLDLDLTIAFYSGATLAMHRKALEGGERPYNIYRYTSAAGRWSTTTGVGWSDFVNLAEWDVINLLHWNEGVWRDADTALASNKAVQPHLDVLVQHLWAVARRPFKLGWFVVHSLPAGVGSYSGDEAHFRRIAEISRQVMETTAVQYVLPVGTAIQNLRAAGVNVGNKLTSDSIHLADGIAPLCAAYASTEAVLALVAPQRSVLGSKWVPTDDFLAAQGIPGRTGSVLGISDANVLTAQRCAICAVKNPYGVTDFGEEL